MRFELFLFDLRAEVYQVCNFVFNFAWYVFRSQVVDRNRALTIDLQRERAERQRLQGHLVAAERGAHGTHSEYLKGTVDALEVLILRSITLCVARGFDGFWWVFVGVSLVSRGTLFFFHRCFVFLLITSMGKIDDRKLSIVATGPAWSGDVVLIADCVRYF